MSSLMNKKGLSGATQRRDASARNANVIKTPIVSRRNQMVAFRESSSLDHVCSSRCVCARAAAKTATVTLEKQFDMRAR